ncbi:endo-1,4-beta-xylanase [Pelagicoccus mobilis]|uniref:Beta-xylanase n=1 Tax=Pelagicoccus mobilis TaxID=415221 RepID=A0A934RYC6_9BACT|nr:endo-1,4-beta-xylanase [Pelagicoccus mobilis]MBK1877740.1 endo-1,4-beta-xylanase [Pelagicoccus mobilis]
MKLWITTAILASAIALTGCQETDENDPPSLHEAFEGKFLIGGTLSDSMLENASDPGFAIVSKHFNSLSPENCMKWGNMNPLLDQYEWELSDRFVEYGHNFGQEMVGHVLFWHSQTPDWVFEDENGAPLSKEALLERMRERARLMAKRWGDRIKIWDVVNESIEGDGSWRKSKYQQILGDEFTELAFRIAMEELPTDAILLYNDYGMTDPGRRDAVVAMIQDFKSKGIRIDGVGMQGHWEMSYPALSEIEDSLTAFAATGVKVHITELDLDLLGRGKFFGANVDIERLKADPATNPYPDGNLPPSEEKRFAERYAEIFDVLLKHHEKIDRVTFWGVSDLTTWLNGFPVEGRTNFALLFDRQFKPKPAFYRVLETARKR